MGASGTAPLCAGGCLVMGQVLVGAGCGCGFAGGARPGRFADIFFAGIRHRANQRPGLLSKLRRVILPSASSSSSPVHSFSSSVPPNDRPTDTRLCHRHPPSLLALLVLLSPAPPNQLCPRH